MNMAEPHRFRLTPGGQTIAAPSERASHIAVVDWANWAAGQWPELRGLIHVPNGEYRHDRTGALLKRIGAKAGVPDFMLPTAHDGFIGFAMELKRKPNKLTDQQQWWLEFLSSCGWFTVVAWRVARAGGCLLLYRPSGPFKHPLANKNQGRFCNVHQ